MAGYKNPPKEYQFKPGQSGNPNGHSRKRRVLSALESLIDEKDRGRDAAAVLFAMATGQKLQGRSPDLDWFKLMLELLGETGLSAIVQAASSSDNVNAFRDELARIKDQRGKDQKRRARKRS